MSDKYYEKDGSVYKEGVFSDEKVGDLKSGWGGDYLDKGLLGGTSNADRNPFSGEITITENRHFTDDSESGITISKNAFSGHGQDSEEWTRPINSHNSYQRSGDPNQHKDANDNYSKGYSDKSTHFIPDTDYDYAKRLLSPYLETSSEKDEMFLEDEKSLTVKKTEGPNYTKIVLVSATVVLTYVALAPQIKSAFSKLDKYVDSLIPEPRGNPGIIKGVLGEFTELLNTIKALGREIKKCLFS